ncbi:DNA polymerase III subunit delta [Clostridia bacterium]|nr:DNA polymerase III subunit delta [Clostridia bacterium]
MDKIEDWLSKNGSKPLYVIAGENGFLRNENERELLDCIRLDREVEKLAENEPLEVLVESANMLSLFGTGKVIIQRNPVWLKKAEELDELMQWVENPVPGITVVIVWEFKADKRKKSFKWFTKKGSMIFCDNLKPWELPAWIKKRFAIRKKRIDPTAAEALLALVGDSQALLDNEIEKICLYAGTQKDIPLSMVEELSSASAEAGIFDFIDTLCAKQGVACLNKLDNLLKMKEPEVKINFMIARQFRILLQGKQLKRSGVLRQDIASKMKVNPYVWKKAEPFVDRYSESILEEYFFKSQKLDWDMKSGKGEPRVLLEQLILDFCSNES